MNPLTNLKERLNYLAIAGIELINEDYRLQQLLEQFSTIAAQSPILNRVYLNLQELFKANKEDKAKVLLNLLGLVNAICTTQAQTNITSDEVIDFDTNTKLDLECNVKYSVLSPILEVLNDKSTTSTKVIESAIKSTPYIFNDYRVIQALIKRVDVSYTSLSVLSDHILECLGTNNSINLIKQDDYKQIIKNYPIKQQTNLVSMLKNNFKYTKDYLESDSALACFNLIANIAKAQENDFYLSLLQKLETILKKPNQLTFACIYALRYNEENADLLIQLSKQKSYKDIPLAALSSFDVTKYLDFWIKQINEDINAADFIKNTDNSIIADIIANAIQTELDQIINGKKTNHYILHKLLNYTCAKTSASIIAVYQRILDNVTILKEQDRSLEVIKNLNLIIIKGLLTSCPKSLVEFLQALNKKQKQALLKACFVADLLNYDAKTVYKLWAEDVKLKNKQYAELFAGLVNNKNGCYLNLSMYFVDKVITPYYKDDFTPYYQLEGIVNSPYFEYLYSHENRYLKKFYSSKKYDIFDETVSRHIKEPLDQRWIDIFIQAELKHILPMFINTDDKQLCTKIGKFYYDQLANLDLPYNNKLIKNISFYLDMMHYCSYNKFDDIILIICKQYYNFDPWYVKILLEKIKNFVDEQSLQKQALEILNYYDKNVTRNSLNIHLKHILKEANLIKE